MTEDASAVPLAVKSAKAAISSRGQLYGLPAKSVRDALRACPNDHWDADAVAKVLGENVDVARLRHDLESNGFLDADGKITHDGLSVKTAKAQRRIPRAKAKRSLDELIERVRWVNTQSEFAYVVRRVIVFGSYLSDAPDLGDVDVCVVYEQRFKDRGEQEKLEDARRELAYSEGRSLSGILAHLSWPQREVQTFLKAKDRTLSFIEHSVHDEWLTTRPHDTVYTLDHATPLPEPGPPRTCLKGHESPPAHHVCLICKTPLTAIGENIVKVRSALLEIARIVLAAEAMQELVRKSVPSLDASKDEDVLDAMRLLTPKPGSHADLDQFFRDLAWLENPRYLREGPGSELLDRFAQAYSRGRITSEPVQT